MSLKHYPGILFGFFFQFPAELAYQFLKTSHMGREGSKAPRVGFHKYQCFIVINKVSIFVPWEIKKIKPFRLSPKRLFLLK